MEFNLRRISLHQLPLILFHLLSSSICSLICPTFIFSDFSSIFSPINVLPLVISYSFFPDCIIRSIANPKSSFTSHIFCPPSIFSRQLPLIFLLLAYIFPSASVNCLRSIVSHLFRLYLSFCFRQLPPINCLSSFPPISFLLLPSIQLPPINCLSSSPPISFLLLPSIASDQLSLIFSACIFPSASVNCLRSIVSHLFRLYIFFIFLQSHILCSHLSLSLPLIFSPSISCCQLK